MCMSRTTEFFFSNCHIINEPLGETTLKRDSGGDCRLSCSCTVTFVGLQCCNAAVTLLPRMYIHVLRTTYCYARRAFTRKFMADNKNKPHISICKNETFFPLQACIKHARGSSWEEKFSFFSLFLWVSFKLATSSSQIPAYLF